MKYLLLTLLIASAAQAESFDAALAKSRVADPRCIQSEQTGLLVREYIFEHTGAAAEDVKWEICSSNDGWVRGPAVDRKVKNATADSRQQWKNTTCRCQHD